MTTTFSNVYTAPSYFMMLCSSFTTSMISGSYRNDARSPRQRGIRVCQPSMQHGPPQQRGARCACYDDGQGLWQGAGEGRAQACVGGQEEAGRGVRQAG